jgi:hypothetical protein
VFSNSYGFFYVILVFINNAVSMLLYVLCPCHAMSRSRDPGPLYFRAYRCPCKERNIVVDSVQVILAIRYSRCVIILETLL